MNGGNSEYPGHSTSRGATPRVEIGTERETDHGWTYEVSIRREGEQETLHEVSLSWRDHDYWCGGTKAPSRVVQAALEYAVANDAAPPARFDLARLRRMLPRFDSEFRCVI